MDPMTFSERETADDDNKLHPSDHPLVRAAIDSFVATGLPGAATIFVFAIQTPKREGFWSFAESLASETGTVLTCCWLPHQGGNRNLAAILTSGVKLPRDWPPAGLRENKGKPLD